MQCERHVCTHITIKSNRANETYISGGLFMTKQYRHTRFDEFLQLLNIGRAWRVLRRSKTKQKTHTQPYRATSLRHGENRDTGARSLPVHQNQVKGVSTTDFGSRLIYLASLFSPPFYLSATHVGRNTKFHAIHFCTPKQSHRMHRTAANTPRPSFRCVSTLSWDVSPINKGERQEYMFINENVPVSCVAMNFVGAHT